MVKSKRYYHWCAHDYRDGFEFEDLTEKNLIWLPFESVPINEFCEANLLEQPVLQMFARIGWGGYVGEKNILANFLDKHTKEIGYVLVHYENILGIIGVGEDGRPPQYGYATIFNARKVLPGPAQRNQKFQFPTVPIINTTLKKQLTWLCYVAGSREYDTEVRHCSDYDDYDD